MLTGRRFELTSPTMAIDESDGKREAITVPVGAILKVVSGPSSEVDRMVDVLWEGRLVVMFAIDLTTRGVEIK
jgi:hypothetical protein